jgi:hypothetical protein
MRKHIIGFALFIFIVASGVMVYAFLYTPPMPGIEEVKLPVTIGEQREVGVKEEASALSTELKSFTVDLEKRQATIDVRLDWNSADKPPAGLILDFGVTSADRPFAGIGLGYQNLNRPFASGRTVRRTFVLDLKDFSGLSPKDTFYGYIDVTDIAELSRSSSRAIYVEKNHMIGAISALVRFPLKK